MNRLLKVVLSVAGAFAFTLACMGVGGSVAVRDLSRTNPDAYSVIYYITLPARPGMVLADHWLKGGVFNDDFDFLSIAIDTLIYSALFALVLGFLPLLLRRRQNE